LVVVASSYHLQPEDEVVFVVDVEVPLNVIVEAEETPVARVAVPELVPFALLTLVPISHITKFEAELMELRINAAAPSWKQ